MSIKKMTWKTAHEDMMIDGVPVKRGDKYSFMEDDPQPGDGIYEVSKVGRNHEQDKGIIRMELCGHYSPELEPCKICNALPQEESIEWEKEFDRIMPECKAMDISIYRVDHEKDTKEFTTRRNVIKSFIKDLLQSQAREIREKIDKNVITIDLVENDLESTIIRFQKNQLKGDGIILLSSKILPILDSYLPNNEK